MNTIKKIIEMDNNRKDAEDILAYNLYEKRVIHRAADSIGCHPEDLKDKEYLILSMYLDGLDQFKAVVALEKDLQGECYYSHVKPYSVEGVPF